MKKMVLALVVVLLLACMPLSVLADSPVASLPATVDVEGSVVPAGVTLRVYDARYAIQGMQDAKESLGITGTLITVVDMYLAGNASSDTSVTVRVDCPGLHANGSVLVLHQTGNATYEQIQATCAEGSFTFTASSFSPFGFVLQNAGTAPAAPNNDNSGATPTAPKMGVYAL